MNQFARAKSYIDRMPGAVSGSGGHDQTFAVACCVVRFGLNEGDQWSLLTDYNTRCSPPWAEKDLRHKLNDARKRVTPGTMSERGYRNGTSPAPAKPEHWRPLAPVTSPAPTAEPKHRTTPQVVCPETSPADLPEPIQLGAILAYCRSKGWPVVHSRMDVPQTAGIGTPDFVVALPGGLTAWVEAKTAVGKVRPEQAAWMAALRAHGHRAEIVRSFPEFVAIVGDLLSDTLADIRIS